MTSNEVNSLLALLKDTTLATPDNQQKLQAYEDKFKTTIVLDSPKRHPLNHLHTVLSLLKSANRLSSVEAQDYFDLLLAHNDIASLGFLFASFSEREIDNNPLIQERYIELIRFPYPRALTEIIGTECSSSYSTPLFKRLDALNNPFDKHDTIYLLITLLSYEKNELNGRFFGGIFSSLIIHIGAYIDNYQSFGDETKLALIADILHKKDNLLAILKHSSPEKAFECIQQLNEHGLSADRHRDFIFQYQEAPDKWVRAYILLEEAGLRTDENWMLVRAKQEQAIRDFKHSGQYNALAFGDHATDAAKTLIALKKAGLFQRRRFEQLIEYERFDLHGIADSMSFLAERGFLNPSTLKAILAQEDKLAVGSIPDHLKTMNKEQLHEFLARSDLGALRAVVHAADIELRGGAQYRSISAPDREQLRKTMQARIVNHPNINEIEPAINKLGYAGLRCLENTLILLLSEHPGLFVDRLKQLSDESAQLEDLALPIFSVGAYITVHDFCFMSKGRKISLSRLLMDVIKQTDFELTKFPLKIVLEENASALLFEELETRDDFEAHFLLGLLLHGKIPSQFRVEDELTDDRNYVINAGRTITYSDDLTNPEVEVCRIYSQAEARLVKAIAHYERCVILLLGIRAESGPVSSAVKKKLDMIDFMVWDIQTISDDLAAKECLSHYQLAPPNSTAHSYQFFNANQALQSKTFSQYIRERIQPEAAMNNQQGMA